MVSERRSMKLSNFRRENEADAAQRTILSTLWQVESRVFLFEIIGNVLKHAYWVLSSVLRIVFPVFCNQSRDTLGSAQKDNVLRLFKVSAESPSLRYRLPLITITKRILTLYLSTDIANSKLRRKNNMGQIQSCSTKGILTRNAKGSQQSGSTESW